MTSPAIYSGQTYKYRKECFILKQCIEGGEILSENIQDMNTAALQEIRSSQGKRQKVTEGLYEEE